MFVVLAGTLFTDLDEIIDEELHALIKCVPSIITSNHLRIDASQIQDFINQEASNLTNEQLASKVDNEIELASNLASRRLKIVEKIKEQHPEVDVWSIVAA